MKYFILIILLSLSLTAAENRVMLSIKKPLDSFFQDAEDTTDPELAEHPERYFIVGSINIPGFLITDSSQLSLSSTNKKTIPLILDKSSFYHEFDETEINSLRIGFYTSLETLSKGGFILSWGKDVSAQNSVVDKITIHSRSKLQYREFSWEKIAEPSKDNSYAATLEVIVDDRADTYHYWYLLPMILIFIMLFIRKIKSS